MTQNSSSLHDLVQMANDPCPEQRRVLLTALTELFLERPATSSLKTNRLFGEIMQALAFGLHADSRIWLAEQLANCGQAPYPLVRSLIFEPIEVAQPLLAKSMVPLDADWIELLSFHGQEATRILASRSDLPIDISNLLFFESNDEQRRALIERNSSFDEAEIEHVLSQNEIAFRLEPFADYNLIIQAQHSIRNLDNCGALDVIHLVDLLRQGSGIEFCAALAHMSGLDYAIIERIISDPDATGLATLCKFLDLPKAVFSTILLLSDRARKRSPDSVSDILGFFSTLPEGAAHKTMRFWRHFAAPEDNVVAA